MKQLIPPDTDFNLLSEVVTEYVPVATIEAAPSAPRTATGADIFDQVHKWCGRFVAYPFEHAQTAHVLWIAHTHLMPYWDSTPRLAFLSPEPGSGKTRALEIMRPLVTNPIQSVIATPSYIFRRISDVENGLPTILYDEIDTVFGAKARDNEELRAVFNAGYRRGQTAGRCSTRGNKIFTEELETFSALAMAGIGSLPDTILSRSVIIPMKRRAKGAEAVEPWRAARMEKQAYPIHEKLAAWAASLSPLDPDTCNLPGEITDRDADIWEPLIMCADAAGGHWPERARAAALYFVNNTQARDASLGVRLLCDIWEVFKAADADANKYTANLSTKALIEALKGIDEAPWVELKVTGLDPRKLANILKPYGIESGTIRENDGSTPKGYKRESFLDAWQRYTPELITAESSNRGEI